MNKIKINHPELHHSCSESEDYLGCCEECTLTYALIDATEQEKSKKMDIGYSGLAASLYDLWWWGKPIGDEAFYQRRMKQFPGPALEVGCGTGRLLIPYLQAGFDVEGVDCAPEMLSRCHQKAEHVGLTPILYEQFMQELALPRRYRTIYIPFRSFQLLSKREDAHLSPGALSRPS